MILSTEDEAIAAAGRDLGCDVPFIRPFDLAHDDTPHLPVIQHATRWMQERATYRPDAVMILQPTSPLRTAEDIAAAVALLDSSGADSVLSVNEVPAHCPSDAHAARGRRRQRRAVRQRRAGAQAHQQTARPSAGVGDERRHLRVPHPGVVRRRAQPVRQSRVVAYRMPAERSISIDDLEDWHAAERAALASRPSRPGIGNTIMDVEAHRDLRVLEAVQQDSRVTQRGLASKLGIALGLANIYLKRMIHKGYIKCVNVQPNRISYLITPRGIAEKARLTYEFMDYSLHLYGEVRQHLRAALHECAAAGKRVAICGSGEAAELAYLSLKESGLDPVAIFDADGGHEFLGMPVLADRRSRQLSTST